MLKIDDYSIEYYKNANRVIIGLPALLTTVQSTMEKISNTRKEEVSDKELAQILMLAIAVFENQIEKFPTVDTTETDRKRGEWLDNETSYSDDVPQTCTCSICGKRSRRPIGDFCKWCGADMREEENES